MKRLFLLLLLIPFILQAAIISQEKAFIQLRDIPLKSATILVTIQDIEKKLQPKEDVKSIDDTIKTYSASLNEILKDTKNSYLEYVGIRELQQYEKELDANILQLQSWKAILEERIILFDNYNKELTKYEMLWSQTHKNAQKLKAPIAILKQLNKVLNALHHVTQDAKIQYDLLLTNSSTIHAMIIEMQELKKRVIVSISTVSSKLFFQNELSFFDLFTENKFDFSELFVSAYSSFVEKLKESSSFYNMHKDLFTIFLLTVGGIILFVFTFFYLYKKKRLFVHPESYLKQEYFYIKFPFSTAFILIILANTFIFSLPDSVKNLQLLLLSVPVFRVLQIEIPQKSINYLFVYFSLYIFNILVQNATVGALDIRFFKIITDLFFLFFMLKMLQRKVFDFLEKESMVAFIYKILFIAISLMIVAIGADIYGATLLANSIRNGLFTLLYASTIFYVLTSILKGYIVVLLRRRIASASFPMVEKFTLNIEKMTTLFIKLFMYAWWFLIVSKTIGIYEYILAFKNSLMSLSWQLGETLISISSIFDFFMIIGGTWFIVKVVNILLQVELFSHYKFPRGFPTAITTVLNYVIVLSGGIIALLSLGVTTEQFALVFGALGVGIGFGLRNIIANFISGIIMVFERPIQIGDTIEINNILGKVQGIGTRSSTIKTFDGSEVIIPNADFIAKDITNWTLSDEHRRKTLSFKVEQESDIHKVLAIMKEIAISHPDVLKEPEPLATFVGFGEYYLEFKLYFWLSENLIVAPSDIAISIYEKLNDEQIKMPTPKQQFLNTQGEIK